MKPRILVTGKNGQVGADLASLLPRLGEVVALNRQQLDLRNLNDIRRTIQELRPQLIVNAAAYTAVDEAENDQAAAHAINADAPAVIAEEARKIGAALVHYSTDYVFDGLKRLPYEETDTPHPINVYGETKLGGERAIQESGALHLIFRTEWIYATRGRNFLMTILRLATQRQELRIVVDQIGAPTSSREIARATVEILSQLIYREGGLGSLSAVGGIYHMSAAGETSWYEFAKSILDEVSCAPQGLPWVVAATNGMPLVTQRVIPITTEAYPTPARRPAYSVLSTERIYRSFGVRIPTWRKQLRSAFTADASGDIPAR
jgi:dTDP-4-dehydrorhamnose reductase